MTIAPILTIWLVGLDWHGLLWLDSYRLIGFNHLRDAIRVSDAIGMTIAPVLTVLLVGFDRIRLVSLDHLRHAS